MAEGEESLAVAFRRLAGQLVRAWALAAGSADRGRLDFDVRFYEEVRVQMAQYDAEGRRARGEPIPEEVQRLLASLIAEYTASGEVLDIYQAAGIPRPSLTELTPDFAATAQRSRNPQLVIEALRKLVNEESRRASRHNLVRQQAFSQRVEELMRRYANQQLTSAEVIAELIAFAQDIANESARGQRFHPALSEDELAFYDAIAQNDSAVLELGDETLAKIARDLVRIMQRDTRTDWTVRADVRAKLRSSIKRLLAVYDYPPDKEPAAIALVMQQMESMAPRYAAERGVER